MYQSIKSKLPAPKTILMTLMAGSTLLVTSSSPALAEPIGYGALINPGHIKRAPATTAARTLIFPDKQSVGTLTLYDDPRQESRNSTQFATVKCQGVVKIPPGKFIVYRPNDRFFIDPSALSKIPPDGIDCIRLKFYAMTDSEDGGGDKALAYLTHLTGLKYIDLDRAEVTDKGVSALKSLKNIEQISAFGTMITGTCFKDLATMSKLKVLNLQNNHILPESVKQIPVSFPALQVLNLGHTLLTDKTLAPIARLSQLEQLEISSNPGITDQAIPHIVALKKLRRLDIESTAITGKGLLKLSPLKDLKVLVADASSFKGNDAAMLKKQIPSATLRLIVKQSRSQDNEEIKSIFAPMSRDRGL